MVKPKHRSPPTRTVTNYQGFLRVKTQFRKSPEQIVLGGVRLAFVDVHERIGRICHVRLLLSHSQKITWLTD